MFFNINYLTVAAGILGSFVSAFPTDLETLASVEPRELAKRLPLVGCNDDQTKRLEDVFTQLTGYTLLPITWLAGTAENFPYNPRTKGFSHYFKDEDRDTVKTAFENLMSAATIQSYFNIRCADGSEFDCYPNQSQSFAFAQPFPENMEVPNLVTPGQRQLVICPLFWEDERTKGNLPSTESEKEEWCKHPESKRFKHWESGAHTLLHEISHLDEFGKAAGFDKLTIPAKGDYPEYKAHGTDDWLGKTDQNNARILRNTQSGRKIPRFQNAESLAAFALELAVEKMCGVKDVPL